MRTTDQLFRRAVAAIPGAREELNHEPSAWLRGRLEDIAARGQGGDLQPCRHLTPEVRAMVGLWRDDVIVCLDCAPMLRLEGAEDRRCDRCRSVVPLTGAVYATVMAVSELLLVSFGLCCDCHRREFPSASARVGRTA